MTTYGARHTPTDIHADRQNGTLTVTFDNGRTFTFTAEYLRVNSPSAEVQGHSPDERKTVHGKRGVNILDVEAVGNYAVRIKFDDLHETGIYSWQTLYDLGERQDEIWNNYLQELEDQGLSRDV